MGTRGVVLIKSGNEVRGIYSHFDSYKEHLGAKLLKNIERLKSFGLKKDELSKNFLELNWTKKEGGAEIDASMAPFLLLGRNIALKAIVPLEVKEFFGGDKPHLDSKDFVGNEYVCEWVYTIDLDKRVLVIDYKFGNGDDDETIDISDVIS